MIFNGIDLNQWFSIQKKERDILPPREPITTEIPGREGAVLRKVKKLPRQYPIEFAVLEDSREDLAEKMHEIAALFNVDKPVPIVYKDDPLLTYYGLPVGDTPIHYIATVGEASVDFLFPAPFGFKEEKTEVIGVAGEDTIIPLLSTQEGRYIYGESVPIRPVVDVVFSESASRFEIENVTTGKAFAVNWDFSSGDHLKVNFRTRRIEINGNRRMLAWDYTSHYWPLMPGENTIRADDVGDIKVHYRPAYY